MGNILINNDGNWQQNDDGTWEVARPLPFYFMFRKGCQCGKRFWKMDSYRKHFREAHTDG